MANRTWTVDEIKALLQRSDDAVARGVVRIFEFQTADEKNSENTQYDNGIGFSAVDAKIMSSFAKQIMVHQRGGGKYRFPLSPKQLAIARTRIVKYARQLCEIANRAVVATGESGIQPDLVEEARQTTEWEEENRLEQEQA